MISFELSDEQKMLVDTAGQFARERVRKAAREADESGEIPHDLLTTGWGLGFVQGGIPEAYGGWGGERSALSGALFLEELAYGDLSTAIAVMAPALVAFPLLTAGTDVQKQRYLPACGRDSSPAYSAALLELCYQFDSRELATSAVQDGAEYVLNGKKCYTPLAANADVIMVFAQEPSGPQAFFVEKGTTGLLVGDREANMGLKALPTYGLTLSSCRVPAELRLGGEQGSNYTQLLNYSRVALAALAVGVARGAAEFARDYAKDRRQFGEPIASRQAIAFMLADMVIEIDACRLMTWEAAWQLDRGQEALREAYLAKMYAEDMVLKVADGAVQTLGGYGYVRDFPVEMWLRNARGFATFEGLATV